VETWVNEAARRGGRVLSSGLLGCGSAFGRSGAFAALWSGSPRHSFPRLCGRDAWIRTSSALGAPGTLWGLAGDVTFGLSENSTISWASCQRHLRTPPRRGGSLAVSRPPRGLAPATGQIAVACCRTCKVFYSYLQYVVGGADRLWRSRRRANRVGKAHNILVLVIGRENQQN
jgi:hypothetical protein